MSPEAIAVKLIGPIASGVVLAVVLRLPASLRGAIERMIRHETRWQRAHAVADAEAHAGIAVGLAHIARKSCYDGTCATCAEMVELAKVEKARAVVLREQGDAAE